MVFIGPTLPQLSPEEIARQKVVKFEESMAKEIVDEIVKESPADWKEKKPMKGLYNRPFAWKKTQGSLKTMREMEEKVKKAAQSISLIAGIYGDDDDSDSEEPSPEKDKDNRKKTGRSKQRQGIHVKVQKPASKQPKPLLKDVPAIFQNQDEDDDIESQDQPESNGKEDPPKKRRRWGLCLNFAICEHCLQLLFLDMKENQTKSDRTYINSAAEILCDKLESLNVAAIPITPLKILAVQVEVRLEHYPGFLHDHKICFSDIVRGMAERRVGTELPRQGAAKADHPNDRDRVQRSRSSRMASHLGQVRTARFFAPSSISFSRESIMNTML